MDCLCVRSAPGQHRPWLDRAPALLTAPFARTGVPVKHAQGLHSSSEDDEPPQLVSGKYADEGGFEGGDTMAAMCIERMERKLPIPELDQQRLISSRV